MNELKAPQQNQILGKIAEILRMAEQNRSAEFLPNSLNVFGLFSDLLLPSSRTVEKMSYGDPLFRMPQQSRIPITADKEYLADVAGMVPFAAPAAKPSAQVVQKLAREIQTTPPVGAIGQTTRQSFVPGVDPGKELIVHHNITPQKLQKVERVGGMPVPSIAVSNVDNPLSGFGEISLIGNPSMAIPSAKNPVFGFDAYTARAPRITYKFDAKSEKNLNNLFADVKGDVKTTGVYDLVDNWDSREFNDLLRAKFLKEKGVLPDASDFKDKWDFSRALQEATDANYPEYKAWVNDFDTRLTSAGVNIQEKIFKGFTPSGTRRYAEANLENLVKEMKGGAGSEGINYGVGNLRAVATPKFKKLDDIKTSRDKIVPSEQFEKVKKEINVAYEDLSNRIAKLGDKEGYGYKPEDVLYEIGQTKNVNMIDRFKDGVDEQLKADIGIFIKKLRQLPTEYFEIKPQRAVKVSEFEGAIVPADVPQSSIDYLRNQGIERIYYYSTPEERTQLFKQFGDKMFGAAPVGFAGLGYDQDKNKRNIETFNSQEVKLDDLNNTLFENIFSNPLMQDTTR